MTNGSVVTDNGKNILLYRGWTENGDLSATTYLAPSRFKISVATPDPNETDTALTTVIPIDDGTVLHAGATALTGEFGGADTTDDVVTYKQGGGVSDNTAQDLLTNPTSTSKAWTATITGATSTQNCGFWLYIKDAATLAKIKTSGGAGPIEVRIGVDQSNYLFVYVGYGILTTGWNWLDLGVIGDWTTYGFPTNPMTYFWFRITTNNDSDMFSAGDVVFDLLREWVSSDTLSSFSAGYPTFNTTNKTVTVACYLDAAHANGFLIDGCGVFNQDTSPLMTDKGKFTSESKSSSDQLVVVFMNRVR
jgi:hypothetical protein